MSVRYLLLVLGDQLDRNSTLVQMGDPSRDVIVMIEALEESTHVWSSKVRTALFLSAMRHHAQWLRDAGWRVDYRGLETHALPTLDEGLSQAISHHAPLEVRSVEAGDLRVQAQVVEVCRRARVPLQIEPDSHFMCDHATFRAWAGTSKSLRMEFFYRVMRKRFDVLMDGESPVGGAWNYDAENRAAFGRSGPQNVPPSPRFAPDALTQSVFAVVEQAFPDHPGDLTHFNWPVTREEALIALDDFISHRLNGFGAHQDAMWTTLPFGWHSLLSSSLNLKLLNPREVVDQAQHAYLSGRCSLPDAEGFIRQVLGWREFVRGVYFLETAALKTANHFGHQNPLPHWYWTGETKMNCMRHAIGQTLEHGYAHHIQRLMVTGMFGLTAQITPQALCDWYLAVYVDAVEWVELPNTAGMALFANGGRFTSKPYIASGAYVKRMSNYCEGCCYKPELKTGLRACPMTTLYWGFVDRHQESLAKNPRTALIAKNLSRFSDDEREAIRYEAARMLGDLDAL